MRKTALVIALLVAAVVAVGYFTFARSWPPRDETLVYRFKTDAPSLDPALARDTTSSTVLQCIVDGLVEQDPVTLEVRPELAESWEISDDKTVYTFHLRHGVKFHNGRQVTAEDFRYSMERTLNPATAADQRWVLGQIKGADAFKGTPGEHVEGIEVLDPYTLRLTITRPYEPFLALLSMEAASPVPREEVERWGDDFASHPMGCGPYRFVKWKPDVTIVLERFDGYWGPPPKIKYIKFKVIPEDAVALQKFLNGDFDILPELPPHRIREMMARYPDQVHTWPDLGVYYMGFNHTKPPFQGNAKLRQALNYAVDKQAICDVLEEGIPTPARGVLPPLFGSFDPTLEGYPYDKEKAKALLAEAGFPDGKGLSEITLQFNTSEHHEAICTAIKNDLEAIGLKIRLKNLEWGAHLDSMKRHEPEMFRGGWMADVPFEDNFLQLLETGQETNYGGYSNPEFDALLDRARYSTDPEERQRLFREANRMVVEDATWLFVYWYREVIMIKPYVKGWVEAVQGDFRIPLHALEFTSPPGS
jgi:oligopeptide transport system substrate-binding protein